MEDASIFSIRHRYGPRGRGGDRTLYITAIIVLACNSLDLGNSIREQPSYGLPSPALVSQTLHYSFLQPVDADAHPELI